MSNGEQRGSGGPSTWGDFLPQKYLKATDFPREGIELRIVAFSVENTGNRQDPEQKPAIWFDGWDRPLVINATNGEELQRQFGDTPNDCVGRTVTVYQTVTQYMGKSVPAARIAPARPAGPDVQHAEHAPAR